MPKIFDIEEKLCYYGRLSFRPRAPERFDGLRFRLTVRGNLIEVDIDKKNVTYTLLTGDGIAFDHADDEVKLTPKKPAARRELV